MALVALSVVEQRLDAVRAVLAGASVTEVAATIGVSRVSVHAWMRRYLVEGLPGLADRSHKPRSCPHQVETAVEVAVAEMRRAHPRWGAKRIRMELLRQPVPDMVVPSRATINRILTRQGLVQPRPRKRPRDSYVRWQRPGPMQLWQIDIVGGVMLVDQATGVLREAKVVTGVDDHSRFCVIACVVERATGRAVCLALAAALKRFGVPEEILTDNGKQFTDRFGRHGTRNGEVLFDKICRRNAITHRLTQPASPTTTGKIERFHLTLRRELLDEAKPFASVEEAQAAVDAFVAQYNTDRPHQALDDQVPITPAQRFTPVPEQQRDLLELWLPPTVAPTPAEHTEPGQANESEEAEQPPAAPRSWSGGPVEFDKVVPPSGNMTVARRQFWLGPARAGKVVRFWASTEVIHLCIGGGRVKSVHSHLSVADLAKLIADGAVNAGPAPIPTLGDGQAVEVDRVVAPGGTVCLAGRQYVAAALLAGRQVGIRIEVTTLLFFDLDTRELLRTRPNPLTPEQVVRLRGARPAGPPPRPNLEPVRVQRNADRSGSVTVCGQRVGVGRAYAHRILTVLVSETTLTIELDDGDTHIVRRTNTRPVTILKARPPRRSTSVS